MHCEYTGFFVLAVYSNENIGSIKTWWVHWLINGDFLIAFTVDQHMINELVDVINVK